MKCQTAWRRESPQWTLAPIVARVPMSQSISPNFWGQAVNTEHLLCARPGDAALHGVSGMELRDLPFPFAALLEPGGPTGAERGLTGGGAGGEAWPPGVPVPSYLGSRLV